MLQHLAEKRNGFSETEIQQLEQLAGQYPYFSGAHILLSLAFGENNDHRRVAQIGATAARVSSRASLKTLTTHFTVKENSAPGIAISTPALADLILTEENTNLTTEISMVSSEATVEAFAAVEISQIPEIELTDLPNHELQGLQTGILIEAIQSTIELEVAPHEKDSLPIEISDVALSSYTTWLLQRAQSMETQEGKNVTSIFTEEQREDNEPVVTSPEMIPMIDQRPATNTNWSVIDRFIETEPQIAKGKVGAYSSGDMTRGSFKEEDEFYTETMAKLLAQQGKADKARLVFKKLMELHPEKSIYFAAQLKNLELIKNK